MTHIQIFIFAVVAFLSSVSCVRRRPLSVVLEQNEEDAPTQHQNIDTRYPPFVRSTSGPEKEPREDMKQVKAPVVQNYSRRSLSCPAALRRSEHITGQIVDLYLGKDENKQQQTNNQTAQNCCKGK